MMGDLWKSKWIYHKEHLYLCLSIYKCSLWQIHWDFGFIPKLERCPGEGNGNPLQDSCLENPMDRGAWRTTVLGVVKSQTPLRDWAQTDGHSFITFWKPTRKEIRKEEMTVSDVARSVSEKSEGRFRQLRSVAVSEITGAGPLNACVANAGQGRVSSLLKCLCVLWSLSLIGSRCLLVSSRPFLHCRFDQSHDQRNLGRKYLLCA